MAYLLFKSNFELAFFIRLRHNIRMKTPLDDIRKKMTDLNVSQRWLAQQAKMSPPHLSNILNGHVEPHESTWDRLNAALQQAERAKSGDGAPSSRSSDVIYIPDTDPSRQDPQMRRAGISAMTYVQAGDRVDYARGVLGDEYLPRVLFPYARYRPGFYVVAGDSMAPRILPGDVLIVATTNIVPRSGDILVVGFRDGTHTLKELEIQSERTWKLIPRNDHHRVQTVSVEDVAWYALVVVRIEAMYQRFENPLESRSPDHA